MRIEANRQASERQKYGRTKHSKVINLQTSNRTDKVFNDLDTPRAIKIKTAKVKQANKESGLFVDKGSENDENNER